MNSSFLRRSTLGALAATLILGVGAQHAAAAGIGQASPSVGRLDVVIRNDGNGTATDPNVDSLVQVSRIDGTWRSPQNIGGYVHKDSEIGLTSSATGALTLAVRGTDNKLRVRNWSVTGGWGVWTEVASGITGGPSIATYGAGKQVVAWRDATGKIGLREFVPATGWGTAGSANYAMPANTGPVITGTPAGALKLTFRNDTFINFLTTQYLGSGNPAAPASWDYANYLDAYYSPPEVTPVVGIAPVMFVDPAAPRNLMRMVSGVGSANPTYVAMGGPVAGSAATARPGESTLPNTPAVTWSASTAGATQQADLIWRSDNGCLQTRTKTDTAQSGVWTAAARIPTQLGATRCVWPGRTGNMPLFRRMDTAENADMKSAHDAWLNWIPYSGNVAMDWYSSRDAALGLHQGSDWATAWAPRNWHPNAWFYRKGTSYLKNDGLHLDSATATKGYFVRRTDTQALVAVKYGCTTTAGCTQPLLNLTQAAARSFWLKGADNAVAGSTGGCEGQSTTDGVLDLLSCNTGNSAWAATNRGNYKGLWIDDMLTNLKGNVAGFASGVALTDAEVDTKLGFTEAQWQNGAVALLEELKAGIAALKVPVGSNPPMLRPAEGQVAINYKWTSDGFGIATNPATISATSPAGRVIKAVTFVGLENGWVDSGVQPGQNNDYTFQRRQLFVDQVHALGTSVLEEKTTSANLPELPSCNRLNNDDSPNPQTPTTDAAHYTSAQYNLAASLLNYKAGDWVGDMCELVGRGWDGYQFDLGAPLGVRAPLNAADPNGVQVRLFERGRVIVNPPRRPNPVSPPAAGESTPVDVPVPVNSRWRPTGSNTIATTSAVAATSKVTLAPRQGAVLLYP